MTNNITPLFTRLAAVIIAGFLATGCGGGGSSAPASQPSVNQPPVISDVFAKTTTQGVVMVAVAEAATQGTVITLGGTCTDPENGTLTLTPLTYSNNTPGTHSVTRSCTDGVNTVTTNQVVTVNAEIQPLPLPVDQPPVISGVLAKAATQGVTIVLDGVCSDPESGILALTPLTFIDNTPGTYNVTRSCMDGVNTVTVNQVVTVNAEILPSQPSASPIALFAPGTMIPSLNDVNIPVQHMRLNPELFDGLVFPALTPGDINGMSVLKSGALRYNYKWTLFQSAANAPFTPTGSFKQSAALGASIIPTLQITGAGWTRPLSCDPAYNGGQTFKSWAAKDTTTTWNNAFGYSKLVYDFMKDFALAHQTEVHTVVIENEVDQSGSTWCDYIENDPNQIQPWQAGYKFNDNNNLYSSRKNYVRTLATVKKAFIDAAVEYNAIPGNNPVEHIRVADSGMMGGSISRLALNYLITKNDYIPGDGIISPTEQATFELADDLTSLNIKLNGNPDWAGLSRMVSTGVSSTAAFRAKGVIDGSSVIDPNLGELPIDVVNFHHHGSAGGVEGMVEYLKAAYPGLPIIANEVGMGSPDKIISETVDFDFEGNLLTSSVTENGQAPFQIKSSHLITAPTAAAVIGPYEIVKKNIRMLTAGVESIFWYAFSTHGGSNISLWSFSNFTDKKYLGLVVPENIRAFINLRLRISSQPTSSLKAIGSDNLETHEFTLIDKSITAAWVKNVSIASPVSYPVSGACMAYDTFGNTITPLNGYINISKHPVFVECL